MVVPEANRANLSEHRSRVGYGRVNPRVLRTHNEHFRLVVPPSPRHSCIFNTFLESDYPCYDSYELLWA